MHEKDRIAAELRKAFDGNAWHGPALSELLGDISAADAAARPIENAHTIWEIVLHIAAWENVVRARLEGKTLDEPAEGDWPPANGSNERAWNTARKRLNDAQAGLVEVVNKLSDPQLEQLAPGTSRTLYETLHGAVQHNLYHAGQIALLKRALA
ncbi:MAG TPA: DinB family protein [Blastocatellia bacterium]|nr:DinB family protein [Blastocatellia bacterium]